MLKLCLLEANFLRPLIIAYYFLKDCLEVKSPDKALGLKQLSHPTKTY